MSYTVTGHETEILIAEPFADPSTATWVEVESFLADEDTDVIYGVWVVGQFGMRRVSAILDGR